MYIITFFSMVQKGCKYRINLGKLNVAYMWFGHIQKFALLNKFQSWIPGRLFPLAAEVSLGVFSMFQDIPGAKCKWVPYRISEVWLHQQPCCNPRNIGSKPKSQERPLKIDQNAISNTNVFRWGIIKPNHRFQSNSSQNIVNSPVSYMAPWLPTPHWK